MITWKASSSFSACRRALSIIFTFLLKASNSLVKVSLQYEVRMVFTVHDGAKEFVSDNHGLFISIRY